MLDFFIVVIFIFISLQESNWNKVLAELQEAKFVMYCSQVNLNALTRTKYGQSGVANTG